MTIRSFHSCAAGKRRGDTLPARLRFIARRGVTLVELMIAMLILTIVCLSWLEIIGIQSARKEARRREAVERLAGMMDAFVYDSVMLAGNIFEKKTSGKIKGVLYKTGYYCLQGNPLQVVKNEQGEIIPVYKNEVMADGSYVSPIGYRLRILEKSKLNDHNKFGNNWKQKNNVMTYWLVGELYDHYGQKEDDWNPFFTLSLCLGCGK